MKIANLAVRKGGRIVGLPAISISIYFSELATPIAGQIATAIEKYVDFVGIDALRQYVANNGAWRKLSKRKYGSDMGILSDYPRDLLGKVIEYNSTEDGSPGSYGLFLYLSDMHPKTEPNAANYLRFDFDIAHGNEENANRLLEFCIDMLNDLRFQSCTVGHAFKRVSATKHKASAGVNKKINRYIGIDAGYELIRRAMLGRVASPSWLNAIGPKFVKNLGGQRSVSEQVQESQVISLTTGLMIKGSPLPPVGDVNNGAPDIGSIPEISRLLKPFRCEVRALGEPGHGAQAWFGRFDKLENRKWG